MNTYFKVIDKDKKIGACNIDVIPEITKEQILKDLGDHPLKDLTLFYDADQDYIVFNYSHPLFEPYQCLVMDMLELEIDTLKEIIAKCPESLLDVMMIIIEVLKVRNKIA